MTKLKTLKDLHNKEVERYYKLGKHEDMIIVDFSMKLRAEAIKWYKVAKDNKFGRGAKAFIEEFFNITSEDLK